MVSTAVSALLLTRISKSLAGKDSIASARRVLNLIFISTLLYAVPSAIGAVVSLAQRPQASIDGFVFGAFLAWSFELITINGAFLSSTWKSLLIAAIHPLLIMSSIIWSSNITTWYPVGFGALVLLLALAFLLTLKRLKTTNGISSLRLLQAFLKTWVGHNPDDIEGCFSTYARTEPVRTDLIAIKATGKELVMIVPGVHPGPFSPVGSYDLSELIHKGLASQTTLPIVLHGTGGHERNTPTNDLAVKYAQNIKWFVDSVSSFENSTLRGPLHTTIGITSITTILFGKTALAIISNAPYVSDDLDSATIVEATQVATELGLELSIVDAHNSVSGETRTQQPITKEDWRRVLSETLAQADNKFSIGFEDSTEFDFKHGLDISEGGLAVVLFSTTNSKSLLVTADSNNAAHGLRQMVAEAVKKMGFEFIELCTSDTHALAARNLTRRGYFALGEDTKPEEIIRMIETLARKAETNLAAGAVQSASFEINMPLIGHESLDDFADLTTRAIALTKTYLKIAIPTVLFLLAITLIYSA